jgi:hypothetical protein
MNKTNPYVNRDDQRDLRLVEGEALTRPASSSLPTLASQPFRPGEMPIVWRLDLPDPVARDVARSASKLRIPVVLWVRLATEAARHVEDVAQALGLGPDEISHWLDQAAQSRRRHPTTLAARHLAAYAGYLRDGDPSLPPPSAETGLHLLVPDALVAAWSLDASRSGADLTSWVVERITNAPDSAVAWEAAAADAGATLGEWIWREAVSVRAPAARSADSCSAGG